MGKFIRKLGKVIRKMGLFSETKFAIIQSGCDEMAQEKCQKRTEDRSRVGNSSKVVIFISRRCFVARILYIDVGVTKEEQKNDITDSA